MNCPLSCPIHTGVRFRLDGSLGDQLYGPNDHHLIPGFDVALHEGSETPEFDEGNGIYQAQGYDEDEPDPLKVRFVVEFGDTVAQF